MAIDTAEKRRAVAGLSVGWGITPTAGKDDDWRLQVAWNYIITAVSVATEVLSFMFAVVPQYTSTEETKQQYTHKVKTKRHYGKQ